LISKDEEFFAIGLVSDANSISLRHILFYW
jgi:hypothetical protein